MRTFLRPVAVAASGLLATTLVATTLSTPAQAAPADRGAGWLAAQLNDDHVVYNDQFDFEDLGLTLDVGFALDEVGGHRADVADVRRAMASRVDAYTRFDSPDIYANAVAKLLVFAQHTGRRDAKRLGGTDLVKRLNNRVLGGDGVAGRIADKSEFADSANIIGQAYAAEGLARAGSRKAPQVTRFLLKQQCDAGWFRLYFSDVDAKRQKCGGQDQADTDATAFALAGLSALPRSMKTRGVRAAVRDGLAWLARSQADDGSHGGGVGTAGANANSTGLAAWVLGDAGRCAPARRAAGWVRDLQVDGDQAGTQLEGERGAVAYDAAALSAGEANGITVESRDQWRRTSAQAVPGLRFVQGC